MSERSYDHVTAVLDAVTGGNESLVAVAWQRGYDGVSLEEWGRSSREVGQIVHEAFRRATLGDRPPAEAFPVGARNAVEAVWLWLDGLNSRRLVAVEARVFSRRLRVVGRIDVAVGCSVAGCACAGSGFEIADFKTGPVVGLKDHMQVGGAYPLLWNESRGGLPCRAYLVQLGSGKPVEVEARGTESGFLAALAWYRESRIVLRGDTCERAA